jgi:hypothetical protein
MKQFSTLLLLIFSQIALSQQYDTVVFDKENIDSNNEIYKLGNVYIFDYEIINNGKTQKLKKNKGMFAGSDFELVPVDTDTIMVDKIKLLVEAVLDSERSNENQTQISYIQEPDYSSIHRTGLVENKDNIWIHPIRVSFFNSLETCPFPFVKKPLKIGKQWEDTMKIGQGWRNEIWGMWEGSLILNYNYKITGKEILKTEIGEINCYIIESSASSSIGTTKLKSYFSEIYGFVRYEYELLNDLKINFWIIDYKTIP